MTIVIVLCGYLLITMRLCIRIGHYGAIQMLYYYYYY